MHNQGTRVAATEAASNCPDIRRGDDRNAKQFRALPPGKPWRRHHPPLLSVEVFDQRVVLMEYLIHEGADRENVLRGNGLHSVEGLPGLEVRAGHNGPAVTVKVLDFGEDKV